MKYTVCVLLLSQFLAGAFVRGSDIQQLVSEAIGRGHTNPADVIGFLKAEVPVATNTVEVAKDPDVIAWEQATKDEVEAFVSRVTGSKSNAVQRIYSLNSLQMLGVVRSAKLRATPADKEILSAQTDALILLFLDAQRRGYSWPLPSDFGLPTRPVTNIVRVTRWEQHQGTNEFPNINQILNAIPKP